MVIQVKEGWKGLFLVTNFYSSRFECSPNKLTLKYNFLEGTHVSYIITDFLKNQEYNPICNICQLVVQSVVHCACRFLLNM